MALTCCICRTTRRNDIEDLLKSRKRFVKGEIPLLINSICFGTFTLDEIYEIKKTLKRNQRFYDTAFIPEFYILRGSIKIISYNIMCDGGRLYRPLFVVKDLLRIGGRSKVNEFIKGKSFEELVRIGLVEMVFAVELGFYTISQSLEELNIEDDYCEINPITIYGVNGSCAPMFNHNPGGRANHECAMFKSALTIGSTNMSSMSETSSKVLLTSDKAIVTTLLDAFHSRFFGNVVNVVMMIKTENDNIEDANSISERFAQTITTMRSNTIEIVVGKDTKNLEYRLLS